MDVKKLYGIVTALGTDLGQRAKSTPGLVEAVRATGDRTALVDHVRQLYADGKLAGLSESFIEALDDENWKTWRSRLLLQAKMIRDGGKPAPGHERTGL